MFWFIPAIAVAGAAVAAAATLLDGDKSSSRSSQEDLKREQAQARRAEQADLRRRQHAHRQAIQRDQREFQSLKGYAQNFLDEHCLQLLHGTKIQAFRTSQGLLHQVDTAVQARIKELKKKPIKLHKEISELSAIQTELVTLIEQDPA